MQTQGGSSPQDKIGGIDSRAAGCRTNSGHQKRRVSKQQVSTKAKVQRRQGDRPHGSQPWKDREPQGNEGQTVSNRKPLTVGAMHPLSRCRVPFLPAASREKRARKRKRWKRNHLKKCACLNTLRFGFALKNPFLSSEGRQVNGRA